MVVIKKWELPTHAVKPSEKALKSKASYFAVKPIIGELIAVNSKKAFREKETRTKNKKG